MLIKEAKRICGSLSKPGKMPCVGYGLPTDRCNNGGILQGIKGSVCEFCYADHRGNYIFKNVQLALEKRYQSIVNPRWVDAIVTLISRNRRGDTKFFRWHDSGDLKDADHLAKICEVARRLPDVKFWLPTKEYKLVREYFAVNACPQNLTVRLSMPYVDMKAAAPNFTKAYRYAEVFSTTPNPLSWRCPAPTQDNKCGACRACWKGQLWAVTYHKH